MGLKAMDTAVTEESRLVSITCFLNPNGMMSRHTLEGGLGEIHEIRKTSHIKWDPSE